MGRNRARHFAGKEQMLKEIRWTCACGTTLRYWDRTRQAVHERSKRHAQWVKTGVVETKQYEQRWRKPAEFVIERLNARSLQPNTTQASNPHEEHKHYHLQLQNTHTTHTEDISHTQVTHS